MEQKEFLKIIRGCRLRLNTAVVFRNTVFALCIGAGVGIVFQAAAFVVPLYYANLYMGLALLSAVFAACVAAFIKRVSMEQAALAMDRFGFEERIVTAYENLDQEGGFIALQREDAIRQLCVHRDQIQIPLMPSWKKMGLLLVLVLIMAGLVLTPSAMKDHARQQHILQEQVREKEKEIEEVIDALEALKQEELTQEQQAALQEMIESLNASALEYEQVSSDKMLAAVSERLNYRYSDISRQMEALAQSMQNGATVSMMSAEAMKSMAEKLQQMSGTTLAQGGNADSGQGTGGQDSTGGQDGQNGQGNQNGTGKKGDGGSGQNGHNNGNENGNGSGRGTGSSSNPHDYVSVPNEIADSENLTGNAVNHDVSEYFRAQNGLSWEGTHVSHEAVIGSYEQNAYEGIASGRYPSGMEEVIKEYFSSF